MLEFLYGIFPSTLFLCSEQWSQLKRVIYSWQFQSSLDDRKVKNSEAVISSGFRSLSPLHASSHFRAEKASFILTFAVLCTYGLLGK